MRRVSRRGLLAGSGVVAVGAAAAGAGVEAGVLPGRSWSYHRLGLDGRDGDVPDVTAARFEGGCLAPAHVAFLGASLARAGT